jgi:hypothetical protein
MECKSAIKRNDSFPGSFAICIAGMMAPNKLPKWGVPVLCIPVRIFAIVILLLISAKLINN